MMNSTIYIFGNLPVFQAALTGLQMIFNPANNTDWAVGSALFGVGPVVAIGLLVSLLHITTKGVWTQKLSLHHVGILLGLYAAMFVPQTNVTVQDIYTGQTVIVDNIPIGVAYPAAIVSQLSYDAATQLGQAFQQATATAPTTDISQGFAEPLQQMLQLRRLYQNYVKTDPALADAEFSFFQQCVYPTYSNDTSLQLAYTQTNDILTTVTHTNYVTASGTNMMVSVLGGAGNPICGSTQGCVMTCNMLASTLQTQYANWVNAAGSGSCTAAVALSQAATADTTQPSSSCASAASNLGNVLAQLGTTGSQYIDQMVHACMASAGMSAGGSLFAGTPSKSVLPSYCVIDENSLSQAQVENAGAASMFLKNMLPLMSVLQFLFIAMAPLAAFTMVMAGAQGMGMFVKYIMFGLWTQSWLPVAAMLNAYSQITLAHTLGVIGQAISGVSANITTATASVTLASMPAPPGNGLTLTTIPTVIQSVMQALSNADMLLALTPIITMIVFTGSYMVMGQLSQDLAGEDKVDRNLQQETPGLSLQKQMAGVQTSGNPFSVGEYAATPAMDGITIGSSQALSAGLNAQVAASALHAQAAGAELALSRLNAAASQVQHSDTVRGSSGTQVAGSQGSSASSVHSEGVGTRQSTAQKTQLIADAAYAMNLNNLLNSGAAKSMAPQQVKEAALQETESMLKDPASLASAFAKGGLGGLAGLARGFSTVIQGQSASQVAQEAARNVDDKLSNASDAGAKSTLSGDLGLDSKDAKTVSDNKQVQDALKKAQSAQDTYQHTEQVATQVGTNAAAAIGQGLNGKQALSVLTDAGHGSADAGARMLLAGSPDMQTDYEARFQENSQRGLSPEQAAVSAYAATLRAHQASSEGLGALVRLYNQPGMIGTNPALEKVLPMLQSVAGDVQAMQGRTTMPGGVSPGLNPTEAGQVLNGANTTAGIPEHVATGIRAATAIIPGTPGGTAERGMGQAAAFGAGGEKTVNVQGAGKTDKGAYQRAVDSNPNTRRASDNATNSLPAELANFESKHPTGTLLALAAANTAGEFLNGLGQSLANRSAILKEREPSAVSPLTGAAEGGVERAVSGQAAARLTGQAAADTAAKEAMFTAFKDAGAKFVVDVAPAQAVAEVAASTGTPVGGLVAMAVEGGVVVMNADAAATVVQTGYELIRTEGLSAGGRQVVEGTVDAVKGSLNATGATALNNLRAVDEKLGLPPGPGA